jgi:hypothetical protein
MQVNLMLVRRRTAAPEEERMHEYKTCPKRSGWFRLKLDEGTGTHRLRVQGATSWMVQGKTPSSVSVHHRRETG